ncbi:MAG: HEPN domain-containing protein [Beijerinckiaceae bacterium]
MTLTPHNRKRIAGFTKIAAREIESARLLAVKSPEDAMFHLQQSVEKLVRALIEASGGVAGPTHNIGALADLLEISHPLRDQLKPLHELSVAATRYRYPTSGGNVFEFEGDISAVIKEVDSFATAVTAYLKSQRLP